ncbi:hypothetical protein A2W14_07520 [Candidatus Gottesmanbacteria bacterium RBG_16_37_8]|uniref:LamG-like jellyroll fold domain-containing protein n=1 Tax=Candidatus Gottesmanbacteria bacterium RBG_16_37_8 TaxID=1798371 RepID=A0A1F5YTU6_9BACT|nr:MAG: hypothetical protein A2W14_07520 [Candidatus Gottesmanbacteria bacterium RBG_16_37_8]
MFRKVFYFTIVFIFLLSLSILTGKSLQAAPFGNYVILNGGFIKAENQDTVPPTAFSFEIWIKPKYTSGIRQILSIGNISGNKKYYQIGINGGSLSLSYMFNESSLRVINAGHLTEETWQHIGITIDQQATNLFINGQNVISVSGATNLKRIGPDIILGSNIPGGLSSGSQNYYGEIDMMRISSITRNISQNWQTQVYESNLSSDQSTVILWNFDGTRGEVTAVDSSSYSLSGFLQGGDIKIHYFGVMPTPTKFTHFVLPTLPVIRRIPWPTSQPTLVVPTNSNPQPTLPSSNYDVRENRPQLPR